jgi:hypothetical protein
MRTKKCARRTLLCLYAYLLHYVCKRLHLVFIYSAFFETPIFSGKSQGHTQTLCRTRADSADMVQTLHKLDAHFFFKVCVSQTVHILQNSARLQISGMQTLHTLSLVCKVFMKSPISSSKPSKKKAIKHDASAQRCTPCIPSTLASPSGKNLAAPQFTENRGAIIILEF